MQFPPWELCAALCFHWLLSFFQESKKTCTLSPPFLSQLLNNTLWGFLSSWLGLSENRPDLGLFFFKPGWPGIKHWILSALRFLGKMGGWCRILFASWNMGSVHNCFLWVLRDHVDPQLKASKLSSTQRKVPGNSAMMCNAVAKNGGKVLVAILQLEHLETHPQIGHPCPGHHHVTAITF